MQEVFWYCLYELQLLFNIVETCKIEALRLKLFSSNLHLLKNSRQYFSLVDYQKRLGELFSTLWSNTEERIHKCEQLLALGSWQNLNCKYILPLTCTNNEDNSVYLTERVFFCFLHLLKYLTDSAFHMNRKYPSQRPSPTTLTIHNTFYKVQRY